jgi:superfamily I DNA/RNA helicase
MSYWLKGLNPEQGEAVLHNEGPLLILAGAGSGKTTVLVSRTGRLIAENITRADKICVLTFTNKAAHELKVRVAKKLGAQPASKVWAGTFHGFGLQFLKEHWQEAGLPRKFGVIDGNDALAIVKEIMRDHRAIEKEGLAVETLLNKISLLRQTGRESALDDTIESAMSITLWPKFVKRLAHLGVVDFDELLLRPMKMMTEDANISQKMQARYEYMMVDEFQDTNATQMLLIDQLTAVHRNLAVVGDDDQSIYGWRGAEVKNILQFPKRYKGSKVIRLERNYRSSTKILQLANSIIGNNKDRHGKILRPALNNEGQIPELFVYDDENIEVDQVVGELSAFNKQGYRWRDIAILYRSNAQGGLIEGGLRGTQIPYKLSGGTALFDRKEAKDALAFVRNSLYPTEVSLRRIINLPPRGIGEKTLDSIEEVSKTLDFQQKALTWAKLNPEEKAAQSIHDVFIFLKELRTNLLESTQDAEEVLTSELRRLGYREYLNQAYRDPQVAEKRWLSVMIVGRILNGMFNRWGRTRETLEKFIDCMELRDPAEDSSEEQPDEVQLMTLHACKGLEFPLVILLGLEEDLLPHARLGQDVDEERRLFYVGVTRAQKHLILTRVKQRKRYGQLKPVAASRFLLEIDPALFQELEGGRPLAPADREAMVANFLKKLERKIAERET